MEKFIQLPDGTTAFITGCKDDSGCEHQWDGEALITFSNSELEFKESEYMKMFKTMPEDEWKEWHKDKGAITGQVTCSKCGMPYMTYDNPYYH
jgi:hypothetical protein